MFFRTPFYISAFAIVVIATIGVWFTPFYTLALIATVAFIATVIADALILFFTKAEGTRLCSSKLDLGEQNIIRVAVRMSVKYITGCYLIDEMPIQLQQDLDTIPTQKSEGEDGSVSFTTTYTIYPTQRGCYPLGRLLAFIRFLGLVERRITLEPAGRTIDVYPAFSRLREKEQHARSLQSISNGSHKRQQPNNQTEFQDIREYVVGDDIRTINWKATARAGKTMVNNYEEERSQHIFNIIDCGRTMHRTFNSLTLQDYSINASLLLSYTALGSEGDCVGLVTYGPMGIKFLPPRSGDKQLKTITQQLYALQTQYGEGDIEEMCLLLDRKVARRSLVILYTDYATVTAMQRQLPFLSRIARRHRLVVVNFIDHELHQIYSNNQTTIHQDSQTTNYTERSIATDLIHQKLLIADKLQQSGINCVMIRPEDLSFSIVRKYLELKSRGAW